jgi:diguanylate cyclase (GGDEF)-like protein
MASEHRTAMPTLGEILRKAHHRLIVFAVALSGVSLIASGYFVISSYARDNMDLVARTVAYSVEPAVVFGDTEAIRETVSSVFHTSVVRRIEVFDASGRKLESMERPTSAFQRRVIDFGLTFMSPDARETPVLRGDRKIATVRVTGSILPMLRYILAGLIISICCLGITVIATRILSRRLQQDVLAPLANVADVAHTVRLKRDFNRRVPSSGIAEVDHFANDFNSLLAELQGWQVTISQEREQLERKANFDTLTGLGNRELFNERINHTISESVRNGQSFAVLYCDADGFKQINDTYGHLAGDALLGHIGQVLGQSIRNNDDAYRLGGDEFAAIVSPIVGRDQVEQIVSRITEALKEPVPLPDGRSAHASLSIGSAIYPDDGVAPNDLLKRADSAMYQHKLERHGHTQE